MLCFVVFCCVNGSCCVSRGSYLIFPILVDGHLFVQSLQGAVVTLVELPGVDDGDTHAIRLWSFYRCRLGLGLGLGSTRR